MKNQYTKILLEKLSLGEITFDKENEVLYCSEKPASLIFNLPVELKACHAAFKKELSHNEKQQRYEMHYSRLLAALKEILTNLKEFEEEIGGYLVPEEGEPVYFWYSLENQKTGEIEYYPDSKNVFFPHHPSNAELIFIRTIVERQIEWAEKTLQVLVKDKPEEKNMHLLVRNIEFDQNTPETSKLLSFSNETVVLPKEERLVWDGRQIELILYFHNLAMIGKIKMDSRRGFEKCLEGMFDFTHGGIRKPVRNVQKDLSQLLSPYNGGTTLSKKEAKLKRIKYLKRQIDAYKKGIRECEGMLLDINAGNFIDVEGWVREKMSKYP